MLHELFGTCQVQPQAARLRRPVQAHPEEEGQDNQEDRAQAGVQQVPEEGAAAAQEDQALRARRGQEEEGPDDTVLSREGRRRLDN